MTTQSSNAIDNVEVIDSTAEIIGCVDSDLAAEAAKTLSHLKYLRKKSGYTLDSLAKIMDVSISYLSRLESGSRRLNPDLVDKFSKAFNCDKSELSKYMDETYNYPMCSESELPVERKNTRKITGCGYYDLYRVSTPKKDVPAYSLTKNESGKTELRRTPPEAWLFRPSALLGKTVFAILCKNDFVPFFSEKGILYVNGDQSFIPEDDIVVCYNGTVKLKKVWAVTPNTLQICDYDKFTDLKDNKIDMSILENLDKNNLPELYKVVGYSDFKI